MISKEKWQTISYWISIDSTLKFNKSGFSIKHKTKKKKTKKNKETKKKKKETTRVFKLQLDDLEILVTWKNISTTCLTESYSNLPKVNEYLKFRVWPLVFWVKALWLPFGQN